MAGRGTDIMLGGNADYLARTDLRRADFTEEIIAEATGYADTDDEEILRARTMYAEKRAAHQEVIDKAPRTFRPSGRPGREPVLYRHDG